MNNSREKFEAWLVQEIGEHAENNDKDMIKYLNRNVDIIYKGWQSATEQCQKEIEALQAREKELVEAISSSLNCIREEINLNNYTETVLGDFISGYGDMVIILQYALATVRGEL